MKKRLCSLLLVLLLLPAAAPAEVVGREGMYGDEYIHRIEAPNGQALYYLSKEEEAFVTYRDVNFDGMEDIVVISVQGASNTWFLFFVWDGENYVRAGWDAGDDTGLPNYELLAGDGLVLASCNDGWAGGLHHRWLYRWEGTDLRLVRSAVSEEYREMAVDGQTGAVVTTTYNDRMSVCVIEPGDEGGQRVLWEGIVTQEQAASDPQAFAQEEAAFWQGISR
ncbi:MAG TPA: hypothetical protein IAD48_02040 [Candidatus Limiplasma pullistercoris]|nr:hypothetical protein [Candidatus Limiplasma pullistercoris]